jgi:hypothetical protein
MEKNSKILENIASFSKSQIWGKYLIFKKLNPYLGEEEG